MLGEGPFMRFKPVEYMRKTAYETVGSSRRRLLPFPVRPFVVDSASMVSMGDDLLLILLVQGHVPDMNIPDSL